ncbi:MAG TPA: RibD family protein, partial [Chloroflexota bacterium]|nr:RibD family protein [Chloroflexota bacterium]
VTAKWAMTLDGKLATSRHDSKWVSGAEARQFVHQERDASDAIIVGLGTVLADDPLLTVRIEANAPRRAYRPVGPLRVVFDSAGHTPPNCQILANVETAPVLIATTQAADSERIRQLQRTGAEVIKFPSLNGYVDARAVLDELKRRGANRVLLEGGSELFGTFFERRLVDRILAFVAPRIAGGREAISPIGGIGVERMADALRLANVSYRAIGADLLVEGLLEQP